jgi:hypothetical protein
MVVVTEEDGMEPWARQELAGADLPDRRYLETATSIAERLSAGGGLSYSQAIGHDGRQAGRRLFGDPDLSVEGLLQGHCEQTAARCCREKLVLAVQDTTTFDYTSHPSKKDLGPVDTTGRTRGLMGHSVLMLSTEGQPLGVLGVKLWARGPNKKRPNHAGRTKPTSDKESHKWLWGLAQVQRHAPSSVRVLVIQDREGDVFALLSAPRSANVHLLTRARWDRQVVLHDEDGDSKRRLLDAASSAPEVATMTVSIPRAPNREERQAALTVRSTAATVNRPEWHTLEKRPPQELYLIDALEQSPPEGEPPIHWVLVTTMPITSPADACRMVRYYAMRWMIERLHYVLKSGCNVERLQIDDVHRLRNALAMYYLVAWRLMYLTYLARTAPNTPAASAMSRDEITVLSRATRREVRTIADAVLAIATLGGYQHYGKAPPPGPKRLWIGLKRLEDMTAGWLLSQAHITKDVNQD